MTWHVIVNTDGTVVASYPPQMIDSARRRAAELRRTISGFGFATVDTPARPSIGSRLPAVEVRS